MRASQFNTGNYNSWDTLVKVTLPEVNNTIRHTIIPKIDGILESMLGGSTAEFTKESIDVSQNFEGNQISGIICDIVYVVDDFKSPDAPQDAISKDEQAIKGALENEKYEITELSINTSDGKLKISFEISFEEKEKENDQTGISQTQSVSN